MEARDADILQSQDSPLPWHRAVWLKMSVIPSLSIPAAGEMVPVKGWEL